MEGSVGGVRALAILQSAGDSRVVPGRDPRYGGKPGFISEPVTTGRVTDRGLSPAVGAVLLVALAVGLASTAALALTGAAPAEAVPRAHLTADADAATDRITLTHAGGDTLDPTELRIRISVDGRRLVHQPPIPFFSADGFRSGPTGPFNNGSDGPWTAGETAGLRLATTNDPLLDPGSTVSVEVSHRRAVVAELTTRAT